MKDETKEPPVSRDFCILNSAFPGSLTPGRVVWLITGLAVLAAAAVLAVRHSARQSGVQATITSMISRIKSDPYLRQPETKASIKAAAELAETGTARTAETWYAMGLRNMHHKTFETAETAFRNAIALNPDWSWPYNALGVLLANYTTNRSQEAETAFRNAIRLDPEWSRPYNDLAVFLRLNRRLDEAENAARKALELDPDSVATRNNYGNLLVAHKLYAEAEAQYRAAIQLDPRHPKPYYNLACVCCLQGRSQEALDLLTKAITLNPQLRDDAARDPDLAPLREEPRFRQLLDEKR